MVNWVRWFDDSILRGFLAKGSRVLAVLAGVNVICLMVIVIIDVGTRHSPLDPPWGSGGHEISELLMSMLSTMAVAWCWYLGGHTRITIVLEHASARGRALLNVLASFFTLIWLVAVILSMIQITATNMKFPLTTDNLRINIWPFQLIFVIVMSHFGLVVIRSIIEYVRLALGHKAKEWAVMEEGGE